MCRIGLDMLPSLIASVGKGTWQGAESQSWVAEVLGGERWTSSLSPNTDTATHKYPDAGQKPSHSRCAAALSRLHDQSLPSGNSVSRVSKVIANSSSVAPSSADRWVGEGRRGGTEGEVE